MGKNSQAEFRLGILGGCLSHQESLPRSKLYHRQLAEKFNRHNAIQLRVKIARHFELSYRDRFLDLVRHHSLDGVLLHIRPSFVRKIGVISVYRSGEYWHYILHPHLFCRGGNRWSEWESQAFRDSRVFARKKYKPMAVGEGVQRHRFQWKDVNRLIGMMVGLDRWAIHDEVEELMDVSRACEEKKHTASCFRACGDCALPSRGLVVSQTRKRTQRNITIGSWFFLLDSTYR